MSDDNGQVEKKKQATKEEKEERIKFAQELIAQEMERSKVVESLIKRFDIKKSQAYNYFNEANESFAGNIPVNLLRSLNVSIYTRRLLKRWAMEAKEIELANKIQDGLDKLQGLDIIAPQLAITQDYIQFFTEELFRILARNNAIIDQEKRLSKNIQDISEASAKIAQQVTLIGSGEDAEQAEGEGREAEETDEYFSIF